MVSRNDLNNMILEIEEVQFLFCGIYCIQYKYLEPAKSSLFYFYFNWLLTNFFQLRKKHEPPTRVFSTKIYIA